MKSGNTYLRKRLIKIGIMALVVSGTLAACKPWRHRSPEERAEKLVARIAQELDLDDTQKQTLNQIKGEILEKHKAERSSRNALFTDLSNLIGGDALDTDQLSALKLRHRRQRDEMEDFMVQKIVILHKILRPDQKQKAVAALQKHHKRFSGDK
jgi:Spy/CpxP family protein refolding chaperone